MKKRALMPKMAVKGIVSNGIVYYPYIAAVIFAAFTHFVFSYILHNDLMEVGLYSLLGLEKKHIGVMLFLENCIIYVVTMAGGILLGLVLSKLLFLLLLRLSSISLDVEFVFTKEAFGETMLYFLIVFLFLL